MSICLSATSVFAQDFDMGVKGGVNYAQSVILDVVSTSGVDVDDLESERGSALVYGGFMRFSGKKWMFQPEILLSENQNLVTLADADVQDMDLEDLFTLSVDKVDIPLLIGYQAFSTVRLMGGPVFTTVRSSGDDPLFSFADMTMGYQAGIGFDVQKLSFDARYESNLSKVKEYVPSDGGMITVDTRKSLFQFTVGYKFFD